MPVYADLNLVLEGAAASAVDRVAAFAAAAMKLGYSCIAVNRSATLPLRPSDMNKTALGVPTARPTTDITASLSAHARHRVDKHAAGVKRSRKEMEGVVRGGGGGEESSSAGAPGAATPLAASPPAAPKPFVQLSRITVSVDNMRNVKDIYLGSSILASYDLVAVVPGSLEIAEHALASDAVDILQLDVSAGRMPFAIKPQFLKAAAAKGVVLELCYAPCIRDASCRRSFIGNAQQLLRLSRGRGILLSSAAVNALELRSPHDAAAIARLAGMSTDMALAAMSKTAATALAHAEQRLTKRTGVLVHTLPAPQAAPIASKPAPGHTRRRDQRTLYAAEAGDAAVAASDAGVKAPWMAMLGARGTAVDAPPGAAAGTAGVASKSKSLTWVVN